MDTTTARTRKKKMILRPKIDLEVTIEEAFEIGKLMGARDTLREMKELAILDLNFLNYVNNKQREVEKIIQIMSEYKITRRS